LLTLGAAACGAYDIMPTFDHIAVTRVTVIIYRFWYLFVGWVEYARGSRIYTSVVVL
jgi:hypothetical protein